MYGIGLRAPLAVVDAVDDADEMVGAGAQQRIEAEAVLRRLDLPGVGAAHRRQGVGVEQAGLQEAHPAGGEILVVEHLGVAGEPDLVEHLGREDALIAEIVQGEHGARLREQPVPGVDRAQVDRRQRRVPVVDVDDVRRPAHALAALERDAGEQGVAQVLVPLAAVDRVVVIERRTVDEVDIDLALRQAGGEDGVGELARPQVDLDVAQEIDRDEREVELRHAGVERQEDAGRRGPACRGRATGRPRHRPALRSWRTA